MIAISKSLIYGDGVDSAIVTIHGELGQSLNVSINGALHVLPIDKTRPNIVIGTGFGELEISCDTPNLTIVIECGNEMGFIHSVGAP